MGVGPNLNYLGKGMQLGSFGDPEQIQYRPTGIQTIFPTNALPTLSDLGGITPSYGVANEEDVEEDFLLDQKESSGIADLFRTLVGFVVPGFNTLKNFEGQPYQRFDPRASIKGGIYKIGDFNQPASMVNDFYNPKTGLNRFERAQKRYERTGSLKDLFASSRSGAEFFRKKKEHDARKQRALEEAAKAKREMFTSGPGKDTFEPGGGSDIGSRVSKSYEAVQDDDYGLL